MDNAHYQSRLGMFDEERWQTMLMELRWSLQQSGFVVLWDRMKTTLNPEFVALVEEILGEEAEGAQR